MRCILIIEVIFITTCVLLKNLGYFINKKASDKKFRKIAPIPITIHYTFNLFFMQYFCAKKCGLSIKPLLIANIKPATKKKDHFSN